jgi:hypothetical protein
MLVNKANAKKAWDLSVAVLEVGAVLDAFILARGATSARRCRLFQVATRQQNAHLATLLSIEVGITNF